MTATTYAQIRRACKKLPNVADFCRRHDIPERTVRRVRTTDDYVPGRTVQSVLANALEKDGMLGAKKKVATA